MGTNLLPGAPKQVVFREFCLRVTAGPDAGRDACSAETHLSVGTDAGSRLVLGDPAVSRHHFVVEATHGGYRIRDLQSTNGTFVAGHRVEIAYLQPSSLVRAGMTTMRFEELDTQVTEPLSGEGSFGAVLGNSVAMRRLFAMLPRVAGSDSTVLLEGETGTGKGLVAEAIHRASPRANGPFVVVDCGAIPSTLIETELFGHERGAFTGAQSARAGAFESAEGGTIFLDELGELPLEMQPKLLRVLEDRMVKRVGGQRPMRLNVRLIAATNVDLRGAVNRGAFRPDLYFRLNVVNLRIPPLRERREDIGLLVGHFYEQFTRGAVPPPAGWVEELSSLEWPGNVRELRSAVERTVLLGELELWRSLQPTGMARSAPDDAGRFDPALSFRASKELAMSNWEQRYLRSLYEHASGNLSLAARTARMDRTHLRELLRKYRIITSRDSET